MTKAVILSAVLHPGIYAKAYSGMAAWQQHCQLMQKCFARFKLRTSKQDDGSSLNSAITRLTCNNGRGAGHKAAAHAKSPGMESINAMAGSAWVIRLRLIQVNANDLYTYDAMTLAKIMHV
jgi:hypothetical protein